MLLMLVFTPFFFFTLEEKNHEFFTVVLKMLTLKVKAVLKESLVTVYVI